MQTVILPGHSSKNKEWADLTAANLKIDGQIRPIFWDHWIDPEQLFYPKEKATIISKHARGDTMNIIGHSVGTLVASYIISEVSNQINKVILCGIPLYDLSSEEKEDIKKAISSLPKEKLICFQNINDPHATFAEVKSFLPEGINLVQKESSDHNYPYFEDFNNYLTS